MGGPTTPKLPESGSEAVVLRTSVSGTAVTLTSAGRGQRSGVKVHIQISHCSSIHTILVKSVLI